MSQLHTNHPKHHHFFLKHLGRNVAIGVAVIAISLIVGMCGYHYLESLSWLDSYLNAAMILAGMGPVATIMTPEGKLFAGTYALFSGIIFLIVIAVMMAPVIHRFFYLLHLDEEGTK